MTPIPHTAIVRGTDQERQPEKRHDGIEKIKMKGWGARAPWGYRGFSAWLTLVI
jgi:hypothetical protein